MNKFLVVVFFLGCHIAVHAQTNLSKAEIMASTDSYLKFKTATIDRLADARKEFDKGSFNYSFSISDHGGSYNIQEKYRKIEKNIVESFKVISGTVENAKVDAVFLNDIGELYYVSNKYNLAEQYYKQAMSTLEKGKLERDPLFATVLANIGLLYHASNRLTLSEIYTDSALVLRKKILPFETSPIAASMNNLAELYKNSGKYQEANLLLEEALRINEKALSKKSLPYALTLNNQAMLLYAVGKLDDAEVKIQDALFLLNELLDDKTMTYSKVMLNLAVIYQGGNRLRDAEAIYFKVAKIKEKALGSNHPDYAYSNDLAASLMMEIGKGKSGEVENLLKKSLAIYKKSFGDTHLIYAQGMSNLGNFYRSIEKASLAEPFLQKALEIYQSKLSEDNPQFISAIEDLGLVNWQLGKNNDATKHLKDAASRTIKTIPDYFTPLPEIEQRKYWSVIYPRLQRFYSFAVHVRKSHAALAFDMYNYHLATKGLFMTSANLNKNIILKSSNKDISKKYTEWLDAKEYLARIGRLSKEEIAAEGINVDSLSNASSTRERELMVKSAEFAASYAKFNISHKNIAEKLAVDEAAIEIIQLHNFYQAGADSTQYVALILSKDKAVSGMEVIVLNNGSDMDGQFYKEYITAIKKREESIHAYKIYWERLEKSLVNKETIYISTEGIYNQINLNTIKLPNGQHLVNHKNIVYVTNTKNIIFLKSNATASKSNSAILFGYPNFGSRGTIERLPKTKTEVETLESVLKTKYNAKSYTQNEVKEINIKSMNAPAVFHIATHGRFLNDIPTKRAEKKFGILVDNSNVNPMLQSGLLVANAERAVNDNLEDGVITNFEIAAINLSNADLITLSATDITPIDQKISQGIAGLQHALKVGNNAAILISTWRSDMTTQLFLDTFYAKYVATGNKQKAYRETILSIKDKQKEPYFWGLFCLWD